MGVSVLETTCFLHLLIQLPPPTHPHGTGPDYLTGTELLSVLCGHVLYRETVCKNVSTDAQGEEGEEEGCGPSATHLGKGQAA